MREKVRNESFELNASTKKNECKVSVAVCLCAGT